MITKIVVDGFKCLSKFELCLNSGLNILVGPNGAGKTNIVLFFEFLSQLTRNQIGHAVSAVGGAGSIFKKIGRLDDCENDLEALRPADVSGRRIDKADYNSQNIENILKNFRTKRSRFVNHLEKLDSDFFSKSSWHPRLQKRMRVCDMLFFQAEHDDHHVNKIKELIKHFSKL